MEKKAEKYLHNCLYFTANSLARQISRLADEEFRLTGLSPSHAFLLMLVNEKPGITQKELGLALNLAPVHRDPIRGCLDPQAEPGGAPDQRQVGPHLPHGPGAGNAGPDRSMLAESLLSLFQSVGRTRRPGPDRGRGSGRREAQGVGPFFFTVTFVCTYNK